MTETLLTCPTCLIPNFTARGLGTHRCKGAKLPIEHLADATDARRSQTAATSPEIIDPWARPREILGGIQLALRLSVAGQVLLGHELASLKKDLGYGHGANKSGPSGHFVKTEKTWPELIKENLGISWRTADRMIDSFEAAKVRLKKLGHLGTLPDGEKKLELLFTARPSGMTDDDREALAKVVDKLVDGDSQSALLQELKISKFHVPLTGGDTSAHKKDKPSEAELMGQLAFKFFHPVAEALHAFRINTDREAFLHTVALYSPDEDTISLTTLERDLEAALADVKAAKKARMKPATGKTVEA